MIKLLKLTLSILTLVMLTGCMGGLYNRAELHRNRNITVGQELIDLKKAHDEGIITEKEYNKAKKTVLKSLSAYEKEDTNQ